MILFLLAAFIVGLDQYSKVIISNSLALGDSMPLISNAFHLTLVHNEGIAFGLLGQFGAPLLFVIAVSVVVLFIYLARMKSQPLFFQIAYGFLLGGAIGNLIDRIRVGYVIDFLDFRIWPVFNFADTFISIGIGLLILKSFTAKSHAS